MSDISEFYTTIHSNHEAGLTRLTDMLKPKSAVNRLNKEMQTAAKFLAKLSESLQIQGRALDGLKTLHKGLSKKVVEQARQTQHLASRADGHDQDIASLAKTVKILLSEKESPTTSTTNTTVMQTQPATTKMGFHFTVWHGVGCAVGAAFLGATAYAVVHMVLTLI